MKRTKRLTQALKALAKQLPKQDYQYVKKEVKKGSDLFKEGVTELSNGEGIDFAKEYIKNVIDKNEVNHFRRLKSAFDSNGFDGLQNYLIPYLKPETKDIALQSLKANLC